MEQGYSFLYWGSAGLFGLVSFEERERKMRDRKERKIERTKRFSSTSLISPPPLSLFSLLST